jgi:hypothetical protein
MTTAVTSTQNAFQVNYTVSKEKITLIKNGISDFCKSGIASNICPEFLGKLLLHPLKMLSINETRHLYAMEPND